LRELLLTRVLAGFGATCFTEAMGRQEPILCLSIMSQAFWKSRLFSIAMFVLSLVEKIRASLLHALLSAPRLLVLDEPLTALDAKLKDAILEQLRSLNREFGIPMLYVTHDPREAIEICEEVLTLESGKIIARGSPRKLLA
jgi:ABC-type molybdate transport system ATPase subunit